jgi:hypothetical protein
LAAIRRLEGGGVGIGRGHVGEVSAERARAIAGCASTFSGRPSRAARASSFRPAASSARARPETTSGLSGAMSLICAKMLAARSASPPASTSSPIAISGSISAFELLRFAFDRELGEDLVEDPGELPFGPRRGEVGDRLALEDRIDGRDRLDPELGGEHLVLVDVDLDQLDALVGIIAGDLLEDRPELLAGAAPFRPEIEDDERGHRRLDDVALERLERLASRLRVMPRSPLSVHLPSTRIACRPYVGSAPGLPSLGESGLAARASPMLAAAALPQPEAFSGSLRAGVAQG